MHSPGLLAVWCFEKQVDSAFVAADTAWVHKFQEPTKTTKPKWKQKCNFNNEKSTTKEPNNETKAKELRK